MARLGGFSEYKGFQNSVEINELATFAVNEHNKTSNSAMEFSKVVKAEKQVVQGIIYKLTIEVSEEGGKELYEASVWVKSWENFKELQQFKKVE